MASSGIWVTRGFEGFSQGACGNAGQNMYVSRAGVLQRIHRFDVDGDGYLDLVFCNSQDHWERPPAYIYYDVLGAVERAELPSEGAVSGAVADLNGDGYDDLALAMQYNGVRLDLNSVVYYGGPERLSERYQQQVPAPWATSVAAGDFNGDGRLDLALVAQGKVRVFYQTELGYEPKRFVDTGIEAEQVAAADLEGDGFADLYVLGKGGRADVFWGGPEGIDPERRSEVPTGVAVRKEAAPEGELSAEEERVRGGTPLAKVVDLGGVSHLFVAGADRVCLVPVTPERGFGTPVVIQCAGALSIALGDVNGDGHQDLVLASRAKQEGKECSWVYWGGERGFDEANRSALPTANACDVAVGDLDGDGCDDIVICQDRTEETFSIHSLVFRGGASGVNAEPVQLESHDARRVLIARSCDHRSPQVIFVNHGARRVRGDVDPVIYYGGADGFSVERKRHVQGFGAVDAVCCDFNDDGWADLVVANCSENAAALDPGSFLFLGGPKGFPHEPNLALRTTRAHGVCCGDLNRDGYLDLVFGGFRFSDILIFYGSANGFDAENPQRIHLEIDGVEYSETRWPYLADLNNDGWLDLVIPQISFDRSIILWGGPDGFDVKRRQMLSVERAACARAADLTGNGWLDLVMGGHIPGRDGPHDSFAYIYWNGPEGLREDRRTLLPANGINSMSICDFNKDGNLDLFVGSYADGRNRDLDSYIYWNRGGGKFSAADRTRLFTHSASGCIAADFNEDGWVDLAIANHKVDGDHVGESWVLWGGADGFSENRVTLLPTTGPHGMISLEAGNQRDRGPEEYYVSAPFELPAGARVRRISWEADLPPKTWVRAQLRFAPSREGLEEAKWQGPGGGEGWFGCGDSAEGTRQTGRWVQYRLALGAVGGGNTPRVTEVSVAYST